jgi:hypothetical protein
MVTIQRKKTFCVVGERFFLFNSHVDLATTDKKGIDYCLPLELGIWWVTEIILHIAHSSNQ